MDKNLQKYEAFVKTVELGSFTEAAKFLNCSQSGISRMIADLEREWSVTLLERDRGGVRLTSDGMMLLPYVRNTCREYEKLQVEIDDLHNLQSGCLRIGAFSGVAAHWLPKIIQRFQIDFPNIEYELLLGDYAEIEEWILTGRVDFGFLRLPTLPQFESMVLQKDRLMAVLPINHPLAETNQFPIEALCEYPFILPERETKAEIMEIFEKNDLQPHIRFTACDDSTVMSMVESGLGISILPELILQRLPYQIVCKELEQPAYREIGFVMKNQMTASLAVKRFREYILYTFEEM
ncbi:MAG: LysR family transcriptional regulator [Lachnospiraceae bacterium]|nr:LysR family transcriptional regulator [Lachnospiraceae bacterium]